MRSFAPSWPLLHLTLALVSLAGSAMASPRQFAADIHATQEIRVTRFDDAVASVIDGDAQEQARFAKIAIEIMIAAYHDELAPSDPTAGRAVADDTSWRLGTRRYVERLRRIAMAIRPGSPLRIIKEPHGAIRLVIGGEQVMLSAPRLREQANFERSIAENICRFTYCERRGTTVEERVAERTAGLDSGWAFARNAPPTYSSSDGLQCIFDDRRHLKLKKDACVNLLHEIRLLAEAIVALKAHGKTIDWRYLRIDHVGSGSAQKITYNAGGSFVRMHLPNLLRSELVWRGAIPWIKANLKGQLSQHVINLPEQLVYLTSTIES